MRETAAESRRARGRRRLITPHSSALRALPFSVPSVALHSAARTRLERLHRHVGHAVALEESHLGSHLLGSRLRQLGVVADVRAPTGIGKGRVAVAVATVGGRHLERCAVRSRRGDARRTSARSIARVRTRLPTF